MDAPQKASADWQSKLLDSGIILAFAAACATLGTYCYEAGYLGFFGLPTYLIEIDQTVITRSFIRVGIAAVSLLALISFTPAINRLDLSSIRNHPIKVRAFCFGILFFVYVLPPMIVWRSVPEKATHWLSIFLFCAFLETSLFVFRKMGLSPKESTHNRNRIFDFLGRKIVVAVALFLLTLRVFNFAGQFEASFQSTYLVINEEPKLVIVRMYATKAIAMPKIPDQSELDPTIRLLTLEELASQKTNMYLRKIGTLVGYKNYP